MPTVIKQELGSISQATRICWLMAFHGKKQADLLRVTGRSSGWASNLVTGKRGASAADLEKLAELFKVSPTYLRTGNPDPYSPPQIAERDKILARTERALASPKKGKRQVRYPVSKREVKGVMISHAPGYNLPQEPEPITRDQVEDYVENYLDEAELHPHGLVVAWWRVRKFLKPDDFEDLEEP